jgi:alkylation response protein AidB-like acyl-CoA dehydrogenase
VDLSLSTRQVALAETVRVLCEGRSDPGSWESVTSQEPGYDRALWSELLRSGLATAGFSEGVGGSGGDLSDLAVVIEGLARVPVPTPILNGLVLSGQLLAGSGQDRSWLADLLAGRRRFATCMVEPAEEPGRPGLSATPARVAGGWTLEGIVGFVPYAASADELLVVVPGATGGEEGAPLFVVEADTNGVTMEVVPTVGGDRRCHVRFSSVVVPASRVLTPTSGSTGWLFRALDVARVMVAADMVGAAAASLDHATAWAKSREQFATPIGSFQAIQHRLADSLIDVTAARDAVYDALGRLDRHEPGGVAVAAAKAFVTDACRRVTASAHQVCGGEGIYADQPVHLWHRRVASLAPELGTVRTDREAVAAALLD